MTRTYELRAYTLSSHDALDHYRTAVYPRHLATFARRDVGVHGLWTGQETTPRLYVLLSFPDEADPDDVTRRVMDSADFAADVDGFDFSVILDVTTTRLTPSPGSALL